MRNFNVSSIYKVVLIFSLGIFLVNCEGEDGAIGPAGENGITGTDGTNGSDGSDGENGVGFDELTKFGGITLTFEGTRPDDVAFTDIAEFKFTSTNAGSNTFYTEDNYIEFDANRFISIPSQDNDDTPSVNLYLEVSNPGEESEEIDFNIYLNDYNIISEDLTYFTIDGSYSNGDGKGEVLNFSMSNYNFNEETNTLAFSFSFDVAAANNNTGNDLSISGEVNVIVLKSINPPR
ncbi:hypothetical protein [Aquimarina sp. 2304DJ70-9]|uniref:hypothetical protein n=1 Tax=Aquimarina penaris TaxID=3231044 RepID=UPI003462022F